MTICAGSEPVGSDPIRTKPPSRQAYSETASSLASTLASTGPWFVSTATMSREGWPGLIVTGGSKVPGSCGRPFLQRMSPAPLITMTSSVPSPFRSATRGVAWGVGGERAGGSERAVARLSNTDTSLESALATARSGRPSPLKSPATRAIEQRPRRVPHLVPEGAVAVAQQHRHVAGDWSWRRPGRSRPSPLKSPATSGDGLATRRVTAPGSWKVPSPLPSNTDTSLEPLGDGQVGAGRRR